jgi:hypothetical protein
VIPADWGNKRIHLYIEKRIQAFPTLEVKSIIKNKRLKEIRVFTKL